MTKRAFERAWTPQEDQRLKRYYPTTDNDLLAERFGRSREAIRVRAKRLGVTKEVLARPYTCEEERIVMAPKYTASEKARLLGRSRNSVLWKIWQLRQRAALG